MSWRWCALMELMDFLQNFEPPVDYRFFFCSDGRLECPPRCLFPFLWGWISSWLGIKASFLGIGSHVDTFQFAISEFLGQHFPHCFTIEGDMYVAFVKITIGLWFSSPLFFFGTSYLIPVFHIECESGGALVFLVGPWFFFSR